MILYFILFISAVLNGVAQIFWKQALSNNIVFESITQRLFFLVQSVPFMTGFILYGLSIVLWIGILPKVQVSYAYPLLSFSYVVVCIGGYFMGESMSLLRIIGVGAILIGISLIIQS